MKPNEVRIGNWALFEGKPCKIFAIGREEFSIVKGIDDYLLVNADSCDPISLTHEMLEKLGFAAYSIDFVGHFFSYTEKRFNAKAEKPFRLNVEYLHQLQNLYFSLTGVELATSSIF